jgi:hypothetical protein
MTFNPPTRSSERWIIPFFGPWLDRKHPNPAMPGELRWFARVDGADVERPDGRPFEHTTPEGKVELIQPLSRTFFPAKLSDNPVLASTNYRATLQALPEPLRSQLLYGDFDAAVQDDPWQLIPTEWVNAAVRRWQAMGGIHYHPGFSPDVIGMDVSHGGADKTVMAQKHGKWFASLVKFAGKDIPDGKTAAMECIKLWRAGVRINVDAIGYGASAHERLADPRPEGYGVPAVAVDVGKRSEHYDKSGLYRCTNLRAEMYWRLREALDPDNDPDICLPDDPELIADLCSPTYEIRPSGIVVESKDDIKKRLSRSPDCGDATALCMLPPPSIQNVRTNLIRGHNPIANYRG